jgi:hypothetical protein
MTRISGVNELAVTIHISHFARNLTDANIFCCEGLFLPAVEKKQNFVHTCAV